MEMHALLALALALTAGPAESFVPLPPGELRGQVRQVGGKPVTRFTVNNVLFDHPEGLFRILTPPEGEFRVVVRAAGFAPNVFHVVGASGKKLWIPEITLGSGEHLVGEVTDAITGAPIPNARASLADPFRLERLRFIRPERVAELGTTGDGGWFELRKVPRGLLVLVVRHPDYLPEFVPVNTRGPLPAVKLHRGGAVAGIVRDPRGTPLPGVRVLVLSEQAGDGAETNADVRGRFEVRKLRPGRYRIVALPSGQAVEGGVIQIEDAKVTLVSVQVKSKLRRMELPTIDLGEAPSEREAVARR